eukprot:4772564-Lingulodinium_polyedra.AAC.1
MTPSRSCDRSAASILSRDGLQDLARVAHMLTEPLYTQHSTNAAGVRGPEQTLQWYTQQARGDYLDT